MGLREVALRAGVSISTVSRVLNGSSTVNVELTDRVLKAAQELQYQPNIAGRNLRMQIDPEFGPDFSERKSEHISEKRMIARLAARSCPQGAVIALDSGSSVAELAAYIPESAIVYTNSFAPIQTLARRGIATYLAPGLYIPAMGAVFGPDTEEYFRSHPVSYYFLSSARIDVHTGLYNVNPLTIGVKATLLRHSQVTVLLVDHHKFVDVHLKSYSPLSDIDILVTDVVPDEYRELLAQKIPVIIEAVSANCNQEDA